MYEWVSVSEASRRLGKSPSTIRRMIESGALVGEREPRAAGSTVDHYRVRMAPEDASSDESPDAALRAVEVMGDVLRKNAEVIQNLTQKVADASSRVVDAELKAELLARQLVDAEQRLATAEERLARRRWWWPWG